MLGVHFKKRRERKKEEIRITRGRKNFMEAFNGSFRPRRKRCQFIKTRFPGGQGFSRLSLREKFFSFPSNLRLFLVRLIPFHLLLLRMIVKSLGGRIISSRRGRRSRVGSPRSPLYQMKRNVLPILCDSFFFHHVGFFLFSPAISWSNLFLIGCCTVCVEKSLLLLLSSACSNI